MGGRYEVVPPPKAAGLILVRRRHRHQDKGILSPVAVDLAEHFRDAIGAGGGAIDASSELLNFRLDAGGHYLIERDHNRDPDVQAGAIQRCRSPAGESCCLPVGPAALYSRRTLDNRDGVNGAVHVGDKKRAVGGNRN